jgi:hypothetical protein
MASRGLFYARLEDRDWTFLRDLGEKAPFDAAIIRSNYLAPYPSEDHRFGESPDRLIKALTKKEWAWALDPNTAPHAHPRAAEWTTPRARNCSLAQVTQLPWEPARFADSELATAELVDRAVNLQRSARGLAAPYFELKRAEDPELAVNCSLISLVAERAGDQRVVAYLQALGSRLLDGSAEEAAKRYLDAGAESVLIRIRRFDPRDLKQVLAYLKLVEEIEAGGARAVADSAGRFGPVAVAAGADAFSAGARFFRKVSDALLSKPSERAGDEDEGESGGGPPMLYEHPGQLAGVHSSDAGSHLASCGEPGCKAQDGKGEPRYIREHNLHEFRRLGRRAAGEGFGFANTLRAIGSPEALLWAAALDQRASERRVA